jgi:ABC-type phosphate transport system permease subunit
MRSKRTDNHTWRKIKSALASTTAFVSAILVILPLGLVFFHLLVNGITSVNWISSPSYRRLSARSVAAWQMPSLARWNCSPLLA